MTNVRSTTYSGDRSAMTDPTAELLTDAHDTAELGAAELAAALDPWRPGGPDLSVALAHLRDLAHDPATPLTIAAALCIVLAEHVDQTCTAGHAATSTAGDLDVSAPETVRAQGRVHLGRCVWSLGEDGEEGYLAEGHDRRALAAINALGRTEHGPRWAITGGDDPDDGPFDWYSRPSLVPQRLWVQIHTTCGCTPAQHGEHLDTAWADPDWEDCPCPYPGLPPCDPDRAAWRYTHVPAGTPGAVTVTEVAW